MRPSLRARLCARAPGPHAHALSAQLQPRMPLVRCPHRSALASLVNRFCSGSARFSRLAWTDAPQFVRKVAAHQMRRPWAPAAAPPRPLPPPQPLALPPPAASEKVVPSWQRLRARLRRTELPRGMAAAPGSGRCPPGACAFHPRPEPSHALPTFHGRPATRRKMRSCSRSASPCCSPSWAT